MAHLRAVLLAGEALPNAAMDATALKNAAAALFVYGGPLAQFPNVDEKMKKIQTHRGDLQYIGHLRKNRDYRVALAYLTGFIQLTQLNVQLSDPFWYEMQKKVVQFMFYTADREALADAPEALSNHEDGPNKFPDMLERFKNFALMQNDPQMVDTVNQLQSRMQNDANMDNMTAQVRHLQV